MAKTSKSEKMSAEERQNVLGVIESEGFDYAFASYGDFQEIKDEQFHKLRKEYLKARRAFAKHIGWKE